MTMFDTIAAAAEQARKDLGTCNILVAGRTGVGKSTLINSVFHGRMATTGDGRPVTKSARYITKEGVPLGIWDTRGLEMAEYRTTLDEVVQLVAKRAGDPDPSRRIHVAWLCVHEDSRRVQDAERHLCRELDRHIPVVGVITKARNDEGFRSEVQTLLPEVRNVVRVRAISETLEGGHKLKSMGLQDLVQATIPLLPKEIRDPIVAAQRVSLDEKKRHAHRIVRASAGAAAAAGATPMPFADAVVLVPMQVTMLARISAVYGLGFSKSHLTGVLVSAAGPTAMTMSGRAIVGNLLKLVPGAGTAAGMTISATTAGTLTAALGGAYIAAMNSVFAKAEGATPDAGVVEEEFQRRIRQRTRLSRGMEILRLRPKFWPFGKSKDAPGEAATGATARSQADPGSDPLDDAESADGGEMQAGDPINDRNAARSRVDRDGTAVVDSDWDGTLVESDEEGGAGVPRAVELEPSTD